MSRIQTLLEKAEREGTARRLRADSLVDLVSASAAGTPAATPDRAPLTVVSSAITAPEAPEVEPPDPPRPRAVAVPRPVALSPALVSALQPNALVSEQFRTLRTRIANMAHGRGARTLLLTSPGRGDGKSVLAANLALTMGQEIQQRVCLVDASLRDAAVHALFGVPEHPGLVEVLHGDATLDEALVPFDEYQLTVLPAGRLPLHPAELLSGPEMRRTLDALRSRFDRVLIDAPPVQPMADVSILLPLVDGAVIVVRAGVTGTPALQQAIQALDRSRLLGVVLNDIHD